MARLFTLDTVQVTGISTFPITAYPFTMCGLARVSSSQSSSSTHTILSFSDNSASDQKVRIFFTERFGDSWVGLAITVGTTQTTVSTAIIPFGDWGHVVGVFASATSRQLFINGVPDGSSAGSRAFPTGLDSFGIGRLTDATPDEIADNQDIAECAVWDVELTAGEITSLASGTSPNMIRRSALKGYWPVYGETANEPDLSGQGNNMTVTGTVKADHAPVGRLVKSPDTAQRRVRSTDDAVILDKIIPI